MAGSMLLFSDAALNMAKAMVAASNEPLLLLDLELYVIAASPSFCRAFAVGPLPAAGIPLTQLGAGEWGLSGLTSLLRAVGNNAKIDDYAMDLRRKGVPDRNLLLHAHRLTSIDEDEVRLLLAVTDMTDARELEKARDQALANKSVLLQELQHRMANSLQIIASVLMLSAKRSQSHEGRTQLREAHHRVMSVAAMQKYLSATSITDVPLRKYFTELCQSVGASMIHDAAVITLNVTADDSESSADVSVSLGLIVTELVINALKHAFPDNRKGVISVDYRKVGAGWVLSISDNGVGMKSPTLSGPPTSGLGTSIVTALATQLKADVTVSDNKPGTCVRVSHIDLQAKVAVV
jgi:two-component sensor histidine kinase